MKKLFRAMAIFLLLLSLCPSCSKPKPEPVRIESDAIEIENIQLDNTIYFPGDTIQGVVSFQIKGTNRNNASLAYEISLIDENTDFKYSLIEKTIPGVIKKDGTYISKIKFQSVLPQKKISYLKGNNYYIKVKLSLLLDFDQCYSTRFSID